MFVSREFTFDSAHFLTDYYGKCERMHGHTYRLEVTLEGNVQKNGLVIDFVVFKRVVKKHVLDKIDHHVLNDIIKNPSAENIVLWIWSQLLDLQKLLREEMDDPNLGEDIKVFFEQKDDQQFLKDHAFHDTLRLHEVKLWETPNTCITYRG